MGIQIVLPLNGIAIQWMWQEQRLPTVNRWIRMVPKTKRIIAIRTNRRYKRIDRKYRQRGWRTTKLCWLLVHQKSKGWMG